MEKEHWRAWNCPFGCVGEYPSSSALRDHFYKSHTTEVVGQDVEAIVNLSSKANVSRAEGPCPLCHGSITSIRHYQSHVGYHLEQLSLFVLPTQDDNDDDQECSDDDKSGPSQNSNHEAEERASLQQLSPEQGAENTTASDIDKKDDSMRSPSPPPAGAEASSPPETAAPADSDPELEQMKRQLETLWVERRINEINQEHEESKSQAVSGQQIREDAEQYFKTRMEEIQQAREEPLNQVDLEQKIQDEIERASKVRIQETEWAPGKAMNQLELAKFAAERASLRNEERYSTEAQREAEGKFEAALKAAQERLVQQKEERRRATETHRLKTV